MADLSHYPAFDTFRFANPHSNKKGFFRDSDINIESNVFKRDIFRLRIRKNGQYEKSHSLEKVTLTRDRNIEIRQNGKNTRFISKSGWSHTIGGSPLAFDLSFEGKSVLTSHAGFVGTNGSRSVFAFSKEKDQPFWGFGEKAGNLNKNGASMKMWNVDVMADLAHECHKYWYDPAYVSIPFFITKSNGVYLGFYLDNPCELFLDMGRSDPLMFYFGSYKGICDLYIIPGPSIRDVMSKFHDMTGRMEMPPVWSLGYHQCRWSYMSTDEVRDMANGYIREKIPLGAMWLDIDYMNGFRVFTWNKKTFADHRQLIRDLKRKGIKLVTIIDPGVKRDPDYPLYQQGKKQDLFCKTHNGMDYVGYVWPGKTLFPDFSLEKTRTWWASRIAEFVGAGIDGIWNDMNDPSTGRADRDDMLFQHGSAEHQYYHNQYGTLMARATKQGLEKHDPSKRSFILTRSASAGIQKYAAVWTGDNLSNWDHLRMSIPESLNLSLSGVSFNGPDVGGFGGNTTPLLITRWHEAGFLFPFFRNHSAVGTVRQEVFRFDKKHKDIMRKFINLRYKLLPYLYDLFFSHRENSDPILRPLFYEFDKPEYYSINDQFMVGPYILQAPIVTENKNVRDVVLPPGYWFDYFNEKWIKGCRKIRVECGLSKTPLYIRDGAIIPMLKGDAFANAAKLDMSNIEFHMFIHSEAASSAYHYEDDGKSTAYLKGKYDLFKVVTTRSGRNTRIVVQTLRKAMGRPPRKCPAHIHGKSGTISTISLDL